jgi:hypothetical protein
VHAWLISIKEQILCQLFLPSRGTFIGATMIV